MMVNHHPPRSGLCRWCEECFLHIGTQRFPGSVFLKPCPFGRCKPNRKRRRCLRVARFPRAWTTCPAHRRATFYFLSSATAFCIGVVPIFRGLRIECGRHTRSLWRPEIRVSLVVVLIWSNHHATPLSEVEECSESSVGFGRSAWSRASHCSNVSKNWFSSAPERCTIFV